jgi:hypothetical protein
MLNQQIRDNLLFLRYGVERVVGHWVQRQDSDINALTSDIWNPISGGGISAVHVGAVQADDIVTMRVGVRCQSAGFYEFGVQVLDNATVIATYPGGKLTSLYSGSMVVSHEFPVGIAEVNVRMVVKPLAGSGDLVNEIGTEHYNWFDVVHVVPPQA